MSIKIANGLVFMGIALLLLPYCKLFQGFMNYPLYDLYVSAGYLVCIILACIFAGRQSCISDLRGFGSQINTAVCFYGLSLLVTAVLLKDTLDIVAVIVALIFVLPFFLLRKINNHVYHAIRYALIFCTFLGIGICFFESFLEGNFRPGGLTGNAATWSGYLGFVLPWAIYGVYYNVKEQNTIGKLVYMLLSTGIVVSLIIAKSRAMLLGLLLVLILYVLYRLYSYKKIYALVLAGVLLVGTFLSVPVLIEKLARGYDRERIQAYIAAWRMFVDHPLIGVGYKHFENVCANYRIFDNVRILPHAHCMYLQYLATTGIIGFAGLMALLVGFVHSFYQRAKINKYFYAGLFGMAIFMAHGIFDSTISNLFFFRICWFFFAIYSVDIFAEDKQ